MEIRDRRGGFLWLNNEIIDGYAPQMGSSSLLVYMFLCRYANNDTAACWPSQITIADFCHCSERTVRSALKELEGLCLIEIRRRKVGDITQNTYTLLNVRTNTDLYPDHESTGKLLPLTLIPTGNHEPDQPATTNPLTRLIEQDLKDNHFLPIWVPKENWDGFVEMRRKMHNAPFTNRAKKLAIAELEKLVIQGQDAARVIDQSTMRGWRGFFPITGNGNGHKAVDPGYESQSVIRKRELEARKAQGL
jgi:hypothetical protein